MKTSSAVFGFAFAAGTAWIVASGPGREALGLRGPGAGSRSSGQSMQISASVIRPPAEPMLTPAIEPVPIGGSRARGPADAPVTIVEFGDFECPFSARAFQTLEQVRATHAETVRIVFKHHPLPEHPLAPLAAEYAIAAGEQGKFWEMHDRLFSAPEALDRTALEAHARALGLDLMRLHAFLDQGRARGPIAEDHALALRLEVTSTPVFFINGIRLGGAPPLPAFAELIEQATALAGAVIASGTPKAEVYAELMRRAADGSAAGAGAPGASGAASSASLADRPEAMAIASRLPGVPSMGAKDPRLTIVEVADFECPYSAELAPVLRRIVNEHPDTIELRFRNLPAAVHTHALEASRAAMAARRQGKFWPMHDALFAHQKELADEDLERYAHEISLDVEAWKRDRVSAAVELEILRDRDDAIRYGAHGTPTVFIHERVIRGSHAYATYRAALDEELEKIAAADAKRAAVQEARTSTPSSGPGGGERRAWR